MTFLNWANKINKIKILSKIGVAILIMLAVIIGYYLVFWGRIFPNIYINKVYLGKSSYEQAIRLLNEKSLLSPILFEYNNKEFEIRADELKLLIDYENSAEKAMALGRDKDFIGDFVEQIEILRNGKILELSIDYDENLLAAKIASISAIVNEPAINSEVFLIEENGVRLATMSASKSGKSIDEMEIKNQILEAYKRQFFETRELPIIIEERKVSNQERDYILAMANNLIDKSVKIDFEDKSWEINDEEMINFLSAYEVFDNSKIVAWVNALAKTVDREPVDALFEFDGQMVTEFRAAKNGVKLVKGDTVREIRDSIKKLASGDENSWEINLSVYEAEPKLKTGQVNDLGIRELIGKGESWFGGSIAGRVHNLELASSKFHGVVVPPGEEFSVLKQVTPIDGAHGYQPAYIIQSGRTVLGDGGGVCQVSTTMFRAALSAGLPILERHPHAYRVGYYEQNYDPGFDASVYEPTADFRFLNDTPAHILIQVYVDKTNAYLKYDLYGTNDGRISEISKATMWSQTPPPPDIYQDDPTLAKDIVNQVDWRAWGAKVSFDWLVTRNGEVIQEETFWTNYKPWAAVYLRGTRE